MSNIVSGNYLDFLFSQINLKDNTLTLCFFRVFTGMLIVAESVKWFEQYKIFLAPNAWFSYDDYVNHTKKRRFSLLNYLPAKNGSVLAVLTLLTLSGIALILGFASTIASIVGFICLVSIHNRNIYVHNSGDDVRRFFLFLLIFAQCTNQLTLFNNFHLVEGSASYGYIWPLFLIKVFMCNIYFKNVLFKMTGKSWRDGSATQRILNMRAWNRNSMPEFLDKIWFYKLTTYGALLVEIAMFTLIWFDAFRVPVIIAGVIFHLLIWYQLNLRLFQFTMIAGLTVFIKPQEYLNFINCLRDLFLK